MGHRIRSQKRGRGTIKYRTSNKYKTSIHYSRSNEGLQGQVLDIKHDSSRTCPIMKVRFENDIEEYLLAPEGIKVGDSILFGKEGS
ncbi:MAG TPA: 50S ribosomal protein L2, partial [Candidatus Methanofastidiosa archaeon]|nr:50S ribosomal protein L2 [Candidatus Methanofastidiosa archaeon]